MSDWQATRYTDEECVEEFDRLFPSGFAGSDVLEEIAPDGWERSPLLAAFHPSLQQVYEESVQVHRNIESFCKGSPEHTPKPEPTREEVARSYEPSPIETEREVRELVGRCLWDIFSDNHEVIAPDGRVIDTGSFRGSGGFIAECLNRQIQAARYDYMDFYMGTSWLSGRADFTPVYRLIFGRLRKRELDWVYHFPQLGLVDLRPLRDALDASAEPEWLSYSPSESFAKEQENERHERELAEFRESVEEGNRRAMEAARHQPPPQTVLAYRDVSGRNPRGWPP